ncbi:MAG: hypothetical protein IKP26_09255, partial [Clostridia bacterium]|nr:hypothetical protein [Clostridia bacterium]
LACQEKSEQAAPHRGAAFLLCQTNLPYIFIAFFLISKKVKPFCGGDWCGRIGFSFLWSRHLPGTLPPNIFSNLFRFSLFQSS